MSEKEGKYMMQAEELFIIADMQLKRTLKN